MVIKFGENVNDRCGNLTKKTELKSADSEHHLVVIPGTFWSRWYESEFSLLYRIFIELSF